MALANRSNSYESLENKFKKATGFHLTLEPLKTPAETEFSNLPSVSVVIPMWNARSSIVSCLTSIEQSSFNQKYPDKLQVVVVDDGSLDGSWEFVKEASISMNMAVVKQEHHSLAHARNTGISVSGGDIIVSCDSDMVLGYYAIEHFAVRHSLLPNALLVGFRTDVDKNDVRVDLKQIRENSAFKNTTIVGDLRINYPIPGWPENMCLASSHFKSLGNGKGLWMPDRGEPWLLPDLVFGALFGLPKDIYYKVGGYDERFYGWGCEDGYFAAKVITEGIPVIPVYASSGLHISHPSRSGNQELDYQKNRNLFFELLNSTKPGNYPDYLKEAKKRITDSFTKSFLASTEPSESKFPKDSLTKIKEVETLLAIGEYSEVLKLLSGNRPESYSKGSFLLHKGKAFLESGNSRKAVDLFKELAETDGYKTKNAIMLPVALASSGQFTLASSTFKKIYKEQSGNSDLFYYEDPKQVFQQGVNYFNQDFFKIARCCFEAVLISNPNNQKAKKYRELCIKKLS